MDKLKKPTKGQIRAAANLLGSVGYVLEDNSASSRAYLLASGALRWALGEPCAGFEEMLLGLAADIETKCGGMYSRKTNKKIDLARALATGKWVK